MNASILEAVLTKLNHCFAKNNHQVIMLMDKAGCHPQDFRNKFSNIKIVFFPGQHGIKLQPLDLGSIQNYKVHFCHPFLGHVVARIDQCDTVNNCC